MEEEREEEKEESNGLKQRRPGEGKRGKGKEAQRLGTRMWGQGRDDALVRVGCRFELRKREPGRLHLEFSAVGKECNQQQLVSEHFQEEEGDFEGCRSWIECDKRRMLSTTHREVRMILQALPQRLLFFISHFLWPTPVRQFLARARPKTVDSKIKRVWG